MELPIEEYPDTADIQLEAMLAKSENWPRMTHRTILQAISEAILAPDSIDKDDWVRLRFLMDGQIGSGSQRGSITRILGTLREKYPSPNGDLEVALYRAQP